MRTIILISLSIVLLTLGSCKKDKANQDVFSSPEEKIVFIYKDSVPAFKLIVKRWSQGDLSNYSGNEGLLFKLFSIRPLNDSTRILISLSTNNKSIYNNTRNYLIKDSLVIDSISGQNWLGDISQYNIEAKIVPMVPKPNTTGTYSGFVLIHVDSPDRYKPFTLNLDSIGNVHATLQSDAIHSVQAIIYRDSFLLGHVYSNSDSFPLDYVNSKLTTSSNNIYVDIYYTYRADSITNKTGRLLFDGRK